MNIKIVSDGKPHGTKVIEEETGVELSGLVTHAHWACDAETDIPVVDLQILVPEIEARGELRSINGLNLKVYDDMMTFMYTVRNLLEGDNQNLDVLEEVKKAIVAGEDLSYCNKAFLMAIGRLKVEAKEVEVEKDIFGRLKE